MNGAHALIRTLVDSGVDVCFANPGTSEMHFVAALDDVPRDARGARAVRGRRHRRGRRLRADGRPPRGDAAAPRPRPRQRHREPAQRAPGAHPDRQHRRRPRDLPPPVRRAARLGHRVAREQRVGLGPHVAPPRTSAATRPRRSPRRCTPPGQVATLVLPADVSWLEGGRPGPPRPVPPRTASRRDASRSSPRRCGPASRSRCCSVAPRCASRACAPPARIARGDRRQGARRDVPDAARARRGAPAARAARVPRRVRDRAARRHPPPRARRREAARVLLRLSGQAERLVPDDCEVHVLAAVARDVVGALERLADAVGARRTPSRCCSRRRGPSGRPARSPAQAIADALGALLPEGAIVADEAQTGGLCAAGATAGAPPHDWLTLTGGAIGIGHAARHRRGGRVPRPAGDQPRGRRQRDVHAAVALDPGPRGPRRHHDHLRQPLLRDPQPRAQPGRRRGAGDRRR